MNETYPPPIPDRPVALRPGARLTFSLTGRCGARQAPPSPPWAFSHAGYVEPDDPVTVVNPSGGLLYFLLHVTEVPHRGDTPARVTVWVRGVPANPNDLGWHAPRGRPRKGRGE